MIAMLRVRFGQFLEKRRQVGFWAACWCSAYRREEAVPVERDLGSLRPVKAPPGNPPVLIDLGPDNHQAYTLRYPSRSRLTRRKVFFNRGYRSFAMIRDGVVIGDVWYVARATSNHSPLHRHLEWFGIELGPRDVYMFDLHVLEEERGNSLTTWFMTSVLALLRDRGYEKAYGYFAAGNMPALWLHRLIGFKERAHVVLHRFLFFESARKV